MVEQLEGVGQAEEQLVESVVEGGAEGVVEPLLQVGQQPVWESVSSIQI